VRTILLLVILFPAAGACFNAVLGRYVPRRVVEIGACAAVLGSLAMAAAAFFTIGQKVLTMTLFEWFRVGDFVATVDIYYDPLAAIMALMVTFISSLIHLYSVSYMQEDEDYVRYFCYLNLFVFAMLTITLADNLVFLYLGWEGVGFCSYALIGFWYNDPAKATAGRKAFALTRIGDVAFGIAIAILFSTFNHLSITYINGHTAFLGATMATFVGLLLLWAAVGKSAQLPLAVWLPDAMAGPTPVSALIHAATMVTAGVYVLMRLFPVMLLSPTALLATAIMGAVSAFWAACSALAQNDIKRILAYSTISQVGYMLLGVGAGDIIGGMFHLLSHAFFKALLFLAAGCVIVALHEERDIFRMGSLRGRLSGVYWLFLAGAVSLSAFPLAGGFFSKDRILLATFIQPGVIYQVLGFMALATAILTPLYTFRLFFLMFREVPANSKDREIRPVPRLMIWTLWPLAFLSIFAGLLDFPAGPGKEWLSQYLSSVSGSVPNLNASSALTLTTEIGSGALVIVAVILAYALYNRRTPAQLTQRLHDLLFSGFYLDRLYERVVVKPYREMAAFSWVKMDEAGVDTSFEKLAGTFSRFSAGLQLWTTGRLSTYIRMLLLGFTAILCALAIGWYTS
jgi:NADH-quinone oxidoreductase subunit L